MEWCLTIVGFNENFGVDGIPESNFMYQHNLLFETVEEALKIIKFTCEHGTQTHTYKLEKI